MGIEAGNELGTQSPQIGASQELMILDGNIVGTKGLEELSVDFWGKEVLEIVGAERSADDIGEIVSDNAPGRKGGAVSNNLDDVIRGRVCNGNVPEGPEFTFNKTGNLRIGLGISRDINLNPTLPLGLGGWSTEADQDKECDSCLHMLLISLF